MPKFEITPAHDESLQCEFVIPRKGSAPIEFTVPKLQFLSPENGDELAAWVDEQKAKDVEPTGRAYILKTLEIALPAATYKKVEKLSMGELDQIWKFWNEESTVELGESSASDAS